jgi:hypothetical protein
VIAGDGLRGVAALGIIAFHGFLGVTLWVAARRPERSTGAPVGDLSVRLSVGCTSCWRSRATSSAAPGCARTCAAAPTRGRCPTSGAGPGG